MQTWFDILKNENKSELCCSYCDKITSCDRVCYRVDEAIECHERITICIL
jgi:hypothetical protein